MRPHRLSLCGIGPYPSAVEIDFDELGKLGLYLVVGPTGAGKTTIFDALTYALYGKVAGSRQQAIGRFASDHPRAGEPFVELEFSHRSRRYRVRRRPPGDERQTRPGDHVLHELGDRGDAEASVTGTLAVSARVQELLGLEVEQFKRVVLLPQGEFQDFLIAGDREKSEILARLFDTAVYRDTAWQMFRIAGEWSERAAGLAAALDVQRGIAREAVAPLVEAGLVAPPPGDLPAAELLSQVSALSTTADAERLAADARQGEAVRLHHEGVAEADRVAAAGALARLRSDAGREGPADEAAWAALERHGRARQVAGPAEEERRAVGRVEELERDAVAAQALLAEVLGTEASPLAALRPLVALAPAAAPAAIEAEATRLRDAVGRAGARYEEARQERAAIAAARELAAAAEEQAGAAEADVARLDRAVAAHQQETARLLGLAGGLRDAQRAVDALEAGLAAADVADARARAAAARVEGTAARDGLAGAEQALAAARAAVDAEHAGRLAVQLVAGEPCPVCGALEHPRPASPADAAADVAPLEQAHAAALDRAARARAALVVVAEALREAEAAAAALPGREEQRGLRAALVEAEQAQAAFAPRRVEQEALASQREQAAARRAAALAAGAAARREVATLEPRLQRAVEEAAALAPEAEVEPALAALGVALDAIRALREADAALGGAKADGVAARAALAAVLATAGFDSAAGAAEALLDPAREDECLRRAAAAAERADEILRLEGRVGEAPLPAAPPDIVALSRAAAAAGDAQRDAAGRAEALRVARATLARVARELERGEPAAAEARRRADEAAELARLFKDGSGDRLSLERWVLRAFFEEVCDVAAVELEKLSRGRYRLTLDARPAARKGLALLVFDAYTGTTRPVELLSGGEKFLASLALALGLAEVVQSQSGGIDLSAMFIDEGFGSLDPETLDVAIDVLRGLLDSGRTIGVITHVEAMKHELPVGLEVVRRSGGSDVRAAAREDAV